MCQLPYVAAPEERRLLRFLLLRVDEVPARSTSAWLLWCKYSHLEAALFPPHPLFHRALADDVMIDALKHAAQALGYALR